MPQQLTVPVIEASAVPAVTDGFKCFLVTSRRM